MRFIVNMINVWIIFNMILIGDRLGIWIFIMIRSDLRFKYGYFLI
jgi:hypothetical protein